MCVFHRDTCAEVLFEDDGDDQSLPAAILDALMKVHKHRCIHMLKFGAITTCDSNGGKSYISQ